jgi:hypothetical protein
MVFGSDPSIPVIESQIAVLNTDISTLEGNTTSLASAYLSNVAARIGF